MLVYLGHVYWQPGKQGVYTQLLKLFVLKSVVACPSDNLCGYLSLAFCECPSICFLVRMCCDPLIQVLKNGFKRCWMLEDATCQQTLAFSQQRMPVHSGMGMVDTHWWYSWTLSTQFIMVLVLGVALSLMAKKPRLWRMSCPTACKSSKIESCMSFSFLAVLYNLFSDNVQCIDVWLCCTFIFKTKKKEEEKVCLRIMCKNV